MIEILSGSWTKGVASIFGKGIAIWSEATDSATCFVSEAARSASDGCTAEFMGCNPLWGFGAWPPAGGKGAQPTENFKI